MWITHAWLAREFFFQECHEGQVFCDTYFEKCRVYITYEDTQMTRESVMLIITLSGSDRKYKC